MGECEFIGLDWFGVKLTITSVVMMIVCGFFIELTKANARFEGINTASTFGVFGFLIVAIFGVIVFVWQ